MKLFIAEKPSQARSIAKNLPGPHSNKDGYIETGGGYVSWCIGHLLETAPPDAYDPKYEKFPGKFDDLPIVPIEWKLKVAEGKEKQVRVIKDLIKKATEIVNAGDPGREGQLIVDELLEYLGNRKPVKRILLNALDDISVKRELNNLFDNAQFESLYHAGMGRQRADWLVGMNMSRAYTILGSAAGYRGVLSVGRVQSPTLAIVVRRDREIDAFIPKDYWTIKGLFQSSADTTGMQFWASWLPPGANTATPENEDEEDDEEAGNENTSGLPWLDEKSRVIDAAKAKEIAAKVQGKIGAVVEAERKRVQEQPPLPFDLSGIQILANAKWGVSIKDALDACQSLYEKGYTTYPRTDCRYLPESQHQDAASILQAVAAALPARANAINAAQPLLKSRAWNDKKLGEHHAIIPTQQAPDMSKLNPLEVKIYNTVVLQFLAQFYPPAEVDKAKIVIEVEHEKFIARGRTIVDPGWRTVFSAEDSPEVEPDSASTKGDDPADTKSDALLPPLNLGDAATCVKAQIDAKKTAPPSRYNQGTLLDAMKKVHTLVNDPVIKKKLRSVEGIGRSATRASIIETLLRRGFLDTKGKQIISSQVGKSLIDALPPKLIDPALTAMWETALDAVATGKAPLAAFMAKQGDWLGRLIDAAKTAKVENLPQGQPYVPKAGASTGKYPAKTGTAASTKTPAKIKGAKTCTKCKKGQMVERTAKAGPNAGKTFLGCTNYPECKNAEAK